jgi:hypothetical protein
MQCRHSNERKYMPARLVVDNDRIITRARSVAEIFSAMQEQGRSQAWFARQLGRSVQALRFYRLGVTEMPPELITKAHQILGLKGK